MEEKTEKKAVGRPKTLEDTVTTAFVLTSATEKHLTRYCRSRGISRSEAVREWIDALIDALPDEQSQTT